jgi:spermidine/putrescine ABC transporter ATP-binding subunit
VAKIQLEEVFRTYDDAVALQPTTLEIAEGEFVTLLGPSGCGKTTTLRIVAGFVRPSGGRVWLGGEDVTERPPQKRNVGMVFQDYALFPHLTVAENVGFGLKARGVKAKAIADRVDEMLELVQLSSLALRRPAQLSGGQQQRVALARAIAHPPSVLLMDEPFSALDRQLRESMQVELRRIQRSVGITTLFVTHDHAEALTLSDRIVVMDGGRVQQAGDPETIYRRPVSRFVAQFLGPLNLLDGVTAGRDANWSRVSVDGQCLRVPLSDADGSVSLGVRPEHLSLLGAGADAGLNNRIPARVTSRIFQGGKFKLIVAVAGKDWTLETAADAAAPVEGDIITLIWRPEDSLVLDQ